jgi:hypothetical protein
LWVICESSANRRKYYLCRLRSVCHIYPEIVSLFQNMKEYKEEPGALEKESEFISPPSANEICSFSTKSKLGSVPAATMPPARIISPGSHNTSSNNKVQEFFTKKKSPNAPDPVKILVKFPDQPSGGKEGGGLCPVLDICREFCAAEIANLEVEVLFCCPFHVCISLYY